MFARPTNSVCDRRHNTKGGNPMWAQGHKRRTQVGPIRSGGLVPDSHPWGCVHTFDLGNCSMMRMRKGTSSF